jgi:DNA-binding NarL/FixJ family response regulator
LGECDKAWEYFDKSHTLQALWLNRHYQSALTEMEVILLEGLEHLINHSETARITDVGYSIADCRKLLERGLPDVLMPDVGLPDGDDCELCAEFLRKYPALKILMLTTYTEIAVITRASNGGALSYVLKNAISEEIMEGIRTVALGERFLCDKVEILLKKDAGKRIALTGRERELLKLIVEGCSNDEIADGPERPLINTKTAFSQRLFL